MPAESSPFDVASILRSAAPTIVSELAQSRDELSDALVRGAVQRTLAQARWPDAGYRIRTDRGPGRAGAWRFDFLIERPDSVLAALEVRCGSDDLERRVLALSRLAMALGRGIAERGFLIALASSGGDPIGDAGPARIRASTAETEGSPSLVVKLPLPGAGPAWELEVIEAGRSAAA